MSKIQELVKKSLAGTVVKKHPTIGSDFVAYESGGDKTFDATFNEYVQSIETIERAIRLHANVISLAKMRIYREGTKGELKPLKVKNVDFMFPNETDTSVDFWRKIAVQVYSQGASMVIGESSKGKNNFYSVDVAKMEILSDGKKLISGYEYTGEDGQITQFKPKDVIYINDSVDPSNLLYSLSRLTPLNDVVQIQAGIVAKVKEHAAGAAKDSAIVSAKSPISPDNQAKIKTAFDSFMSATATSTMFINSELDVHQFNNQMSGTDMLSFFTKVNQMMLDQFNMPPALLGDYSASGANKNEELLFSLRVWFTTMVKPVLTNIEMQFSRYFRETLGLKNAVCIFDLDDIDILDDFIELKVDRAIKLHKSGLMSFNEARELAELEPLDDESADWHFLPQFLTGSAPISLENYDEGIERLLQNSGPKGDESTPAGNSGDEDNTNVEDGTRGGDATEE